MPEQSERNGYKNEKKVILFCFPYAGGGASVFRTWQEKIGKDIKIIPAHYPGHEERIMEKPFESMDDLVLNIYKEISELQEQPFYLFGHSVGSRIAYEVAVKCEENEQKNLQGIIVSAGLAPNRIEPRPIYNLPDELFFKEISKYSRTPMEIFKNKDLWNIFSPMLRADFKIADTYCDKKYRTIDIPVLALRGTLDPEISLKDLKEWKAYTTSKFHYTDIEGEHLFIDTNTDKVLEVIKKYIMEEK